MELRHLRYFVAVAEELHFGHAAERLSMAQPPLSQQIRQLENEIGTPLFIRTNRRVQLTAAGEVFLNDARAILEKVDVAIETAKRASKGEVGWLGIGFAPSAIYEVLPRILRRFREQFPNVELKLMELPTIEQYQALREKRIHVGFSRLSAPESGIVLEPVVHERLIIALPVNHWLTNRSKLSLHELCAESFILYPSEPESNFCNYVLSICENAGFTPNIVQKTSELQTAVGMVDAGIGVVIVPASTKNIHQEGVVYLPLVDPVPTVDLTLGYRADDQSPVLQHFINICKNYSNKLQK